MFISLFLISNAAMADVMVVTIYKSFQDRGALTAQYGAEGKAIHEKLGGAPMVAFKGCLIPRPNSLISSATRRVG